MTWQALFENPFEAVHFGSRGEAACGRHRGRRRYVTGLLTSTIPSAVTCERCLHSPAFKAAESSAPVKLTKPGLNLAVGDVVTGFGSTATVLNVEGRRLKIRWADGRVATVEGELVERFIKQ